MLRYVEYDAAGQIVQDKPDPPLLVVAGAFALALSVLTNIALTFRFIGTHTVSTAARISRPPCSLADPMNRLQRFASFSAMLFATTQIVVNLCALLIFGLTHVEAPENDFQLSTSYWLTAVSGIVGLGTLGLLGVDAIATKWFKLGGSGLTGKQTSLILAFDSFHVLSWLGSVALKYLLDVEWVARIGDHRRLLR